MDVENKKKEYKSLEKAIGSKANHRDLAETCVCFANAQGGEIIIGIEDKNDSPPQGQKIKQEDVNRLVKSLRSLAYSVAIVTSDIISHPNGGEYFVLKILPSTRTIATTSSGKVFIRVGDNCFPVDGEELTRLASEKNAFQWEIVVAQKITLSQADPHKVTQLLSDFKIVL